MYYNKLKREQRLKMLANLVLLLPVVILLFWVAGCVKPSQQTEVELANPKEISRMLTKSEIDLHKEWDEIYANVEPYVHPPRDYGYTPANDEMFRLRSELNPYGISVFRVDPNNPEHQRRYKRHLSGNLNPTYISEEDI